MPNVKMPPCCARRTAKLTMDKANLARLAQKTAIAAEKNRDTTRLVLKIEECKAIIANDEQAVIDHEAEHAAGLA